LPAAAGHQEGVLLQLALCEGRQNPLDVAACLGDYVNPGRRQRCFQWPRDRATDQHVRPGLGETGRPTLRVLGIERNILASLLDAIDNLNDQDMSRHVEDGADSALPMGYRDSHLSGTPFKFRATVCL
jgi:hypothetical protein